MKMTVCKIFIIFLLASALTLTTYLPVDAQTGSSSILMQETDVEARLGTNGTTILSFESVLTNIGSSSINDFDLRFDVRSLVVLEAIFELNNVSTTIIPEDRYSIVGITLTQSLEVNESGNLKLVMKTHTMQEQYEICEERGLCLNHVIFYIRPINEVQNLTVSIILPAHAILEEETASPLYPTPSSNQTDGTSLVFIWESDRILQGQERVYIVKYGIPVEITITDSMINPLIIGVFAALLGAVAVMFVERIPRIITLMRTQRYRGVDLSHHDREVLEFLAGKGGSCPQRVIYEELDMSQSMASMLLTNLEERGLIRRFREGRENMVHLMDS